MSASGRLCALTSQQERRTSGPENFQSSAKRASSTQSARREHSYEGPLCARTGHPARSVLTGSVRLTRRRGLPRFRTPTTAKIGASFAVSSVLMRQKCTSTKLPQLCAVDFRSRLHRPCRQYPWHETGDSEPKTHGLDRADVRFIRPNIQIYDAHVVDLSQWVCAQYLVGVKGAETKFAGAP